MSWYKKKLKRKQTDLISKALNSKDKESNDNSQKRPKFCYFFVFVTSKLAEERANQRKRENKRTKQQKGYKEKTPYLQVIVTHARNL